MEGSGMDGGTSRDELLQRITMMEAMIAEGRAFTLKCGWIFVLWGLVDLTAMGWRYLMPHSHFAGHWAWPVCLAIGAVITVTGRMVQRRSERSKSMRCHHVEAVWNMMGVALALFVAGGIASGLSWQNSYIAGILMIVGMAHAISAVILRWRFQGFVAVVWWVGGVAAFWARSWSHVNWIMFVEMCVGMIAFGLYAMVMERRAHE